MVAAVHKQLQSGKPSARGEARRPKSQTGLYNNGETVKSKLLRTLIAAMLLTTTAVPTLADTVNAAVAANFSGVIKKLAPVFEEKTGHKLVPSFGATGKLYAQISHGAPFDVLLSADATTPKKLVAEGKADGASQFIYARGRLALWSATAGDVDDQGAILTSGRFSKLAIANPKTAPYGQAAIDALTAMKLLGPMQPLFVRGESIAQVQQFVASGNAPLGFVALGQVMALPPGERGSYWLVPAELHKPIDQAAVVLNNAKNPQAGQAFLDFLQSPEAVAIIKQLGYETPAVP